MKSILIKLYKGLKSWNDHWTFIQNEKLKAMEYCGRAFF
jgi:hypothetical protein